MKQIILLILSCLLIPVSSQGQIKIDSLLVYDYFEEKGHTTAGVSSQFKELKEMKLDMIGIKLNDTEEINQILCRAKSKKHRQTKFGLGILFCQAKGDSLMIDFLIAGPNFIVDLTNYRNYIIKNEKDQIWLKDFISRVKEKY